MLPNGMVVKVSLISLKCISDTECWSFRDITQQLPGLKTAQSSKKHHYQMFSDRCWKVSESLSPYFSGNTAPLHSKLKLFTYLTYPHKIQRQLKTKRMSGKEEIRNSEFEEDKRTMKGRNVIKEIRSLD